MKGTTTFGIASVAAEIIRVILRDENRVIPVSAMLHGEYGYEDVYMGVPAVLGASGVQQVVECSLTEEEQARLERSVRALRQYMTDIF